jgi:sulfatase modifying factor 1
VALFIAALLVDCEQDSVRSFSLGDLPRTLPSAPTGARSDAMHASVAPRRMRFVDDTVGAPRACPEGMVLVEGMYCPDVKQRCLRYLDPPGRYQAFRCAEYAPPRCASRQRRRLRFCIDRDEYREDGESLPANHMSFTHAVRTCRELGKRVCQESEWNFACEGEAMLAYPYGMKRDPSACNADQRDLLNKRGLLKDLRAAPGSFPRCASPFGVRDMAGNLEEFVAMDVRGPPRPAMKGAYWQPGRNDCRAAQTAHDAFYNGTETGFRCCAEPMDSDVPARPSDRADPRHPSF